MKKAEFLTDFLPLDVTEGRETQRLRLLEPFRVYSAVLDDQIEVAAGFEFDGESIPVWAQTFAPPFGQSRRGAAVHDWLYRHGGYYRATGQFVRVTRKQADAVYKELVLAKGLSSWRANMRYGVLRLLGWAAWNQNQENRENDPILYS